MLVYGSWIKAILFFTFVSSSAMAEILLPQFIRIKSTPRFTDGPAGAGPGVAEFIGTQPGTTLGTGISGTWAVKMSDKRSLSIDVYWAVAMLGPRLAPAAGGLGGGVTNTSDTSSLTPAHGLDGGVW
jgi:hypothetical protein